MKITVVYTASFTQVIDWPDSEKDNLSYQNLEANLNTEKSEELCIDEISDVSVDGNAYNF